MTNQPTDINEERGLRKLDEAIRELEEQLKKAQGK